jgi:hypothetical protein
MHHNVSSKTPLISVILTLSLLTATQASAAERVFRAVASAVQINPTGPTYVTSYIANTTASVQLDDLYARCIVVDDGQERVAIVVVDSGGLPRDVIDRIKDAAKAKTGLPTDRMLIAATHTHSAPSVFEEKGMDNPDYIRLLIEKVPQGIDQAIRNLAPARIGWTVIQDWEHTHTRRWIRRPDKISLDPFGDPTVRANMHPGFQNPDAIAPSGPSDPDISIVSLQSRVIPSFCWRRAGAYLTDVELAGRSTPDEYTLFNSVCSALGDLATACIVLQSNYKRTEVECLCALRLPQ